MKNLSKFDIRKLFPDVIYKRGLQYYERNQISDLLYDINFKVWTATVHGSEDYFVEINMNTIQEGTIDTFCDCPAFDMYGRCKHVVATLLQIQHQERMGNHDTKTPGGYSTAKHFISAFRSMHAADLPTETWIEKTPIHISYYCHWNYLGHFLMELKAGVDHKYVVKNAKAFLKDVLEGKEHFFTKKFTYSPETHHVLKQDLELLERLYAVLKNEQVYDRFSSAYFGTTKDERFITIPPLAMNELLQLLATRDVTIETDRKSYHTLTLHEPGVLPYSFSISKNNKNELLLQMDDLQEGEYLEHYQLLFHDGGFYFPKKEQLPIVQQLSSFQKDPVQLPIVQEQADVFISEVLPSLSKVGEVEMDEAVSADIVQAPLKAKLYLEWKDQLIIGKLEYHYADQQIDPFGKPEPRKQYILRDTEKEQQIMGLIEHANFHFNGKELYIEADDEVLYDFIYHMLPLMDEYMELFLTSDIRNLILDDEPEPTTNIRMESTTNLLEIGFDMEGIQTDEVQSILEAVIEKKRYYRLQDGAMLNLQSDAFDSLHNLLSDLDVKKTDLSDGQLHMPVYRGAQLDELIHTKKDYDASFHRLLHQLKSPEAQHYELPDGLQATLRSYQITGYQWFKSLSEYHLGGILADDMGLGKTLQSIAYIASEPSEMPHLIVAPSSVVYNWKNECRKFAPHLEVAILTGAPEERRKRMKQATDTDVWITSYATLRQDIDFYRTYSFQSLILDEAQYIKNYATKTSKAIREITATRRFALSGTPIENAIDELWAIFQVVLPGLMPNQRAFKQLSHEKIASITRPFILRRLKQDVLKELPDKIESVMVSELSTEQKELYLAYLHQLQRETAATLKDNSFSQNRMKILAGLTRLRQLCCHPSLFIENYQGGSGKLKQLMDTVRTALENGKRMLIFSQFTSMHEIIISELEKEGIDYFYLHGQTPSQERVQMSDRFNNGEKNVFLISLKAGGTGLNLTGADTVILYDLWWNPAVEDQATGRAHRFGQKNVVQVIRLLTEGTIEEKIYELQQKKRELIDQVIHPGETMLSSLSESDIRALLSIA
ncbi:helicase SNF2 [Ornithinibacillus gellani]|uniref:DEAD/DEAH box helicase n=1 Tax=Ornithinibacillus gellani TaxID=2293253 RepID=UPI000F4953B2|nr:DEAD/DEAH box helicase [Ornithinibacillus gellani]TQS72041.1 helicase SNF2 [Ornithinibacillus gellani]